MKQERSVLVQVAGRVQGVGFRDWTLREADALGLSGWVRNEPDGSVKALLCGPREAVALMLERMRAGPRFAAVDTVAQEEADAPAPGPFRILR